jgi:small subunit ribosomal protein S9
MAEKKTTKKPAEKKVKKVSSVKKDNKKKVVEVKEEVKEVKIETKIENIDFGIPTIVLDDDDFVVNEDDFKDLGDKYFEATGRRKTAVARIRMYTKGDAGMEVNGMDFTKYFPTKSLQGNALASLDKMKSLGRFRITAVVNGGGVHAQAEAVRHGIARALVVFNADYRKRLRKAGFLTRDPRMKERKKPGLKRARRAPQWSKR